VNARCERRGRAADTAGEHGWVNVLTHGGSIDSVRAFFLASPEFQQQGGGTVADYVGRLYQQLLGRIADAQGQAFWVSQLEQGGVGRPSPNAEQGGVGRPSPNAGGVGRPSPNAPSPNAALAVVQALAHSDEAARHAATLDLQNTLRRTADAGGVAFFASAIVHGVPSEVIERALLASDEFFQKVGAASTVLP
jgi:hypothetical protein